MSTPKIRLEKVSKIFGPDPKSIVPLLDTEKSKTEIMEETGHVVGLRNVSLDIPEGQTFVVMGLSGSGKSTLIRHINRLIEPTSGRILFDETDILTLSSRELRDLRRHRISMVFQRFALLPHKTVLDNVAAGLRFAGVRRDEARERAMRQVEVVGLAGFENQYPRQLSGGMQQRVGLARALATDAEILLMDEAFSALDPLIRHDMQAQLADLQRELKKTIVFITHDLDEALRIGDTIAILYDGSLSQVGTPEEILIHPADDYVERFVRDVDRSRVITVAAAARAAPTLPHHAVTAEAIAPHFDGERTVPVFVVDADGQPRGAISPTRFARHRDEDGAFWQNPDHLAPVVQVGADTILADALPEVAESEVPVAVVDEEGRIVGALSRQSAIEAIMRRADEAPPLEDGAPADGAPTERTAKIEPAHPDADGHHPAADVPPHSRVEEKRVVSG